MSHHVTVTSSCHLLIPLNCLLSATVLGYVVDDMIVLEGSLLGGVKATLLQLVLCASACVLNSSPRAFCEYQQADSFELSSMHGLTKVQISWQNC